LAEKIAGVVVLYNPAQSVLESVSSYIDSVEVLYVLDNSEKYNSEVIKEIKKIKKVKYFSMNGNQGIAKALNFGAALAIQDKYDWLLTMDQDSLAAKGMIWTMLEYLKQERGGNMGIVSPLHVVPGENIPKYEKSFEKVLIAMTSGNLLNIPIYKKNGPFLESLFIDSVDTEYCLRLHINGYKVVCSYDAYLFHPVGSPKRYPFFGRKILVSNHAPIRRYYMTRNKLYVSQLYRKDFPEFCKSELKENWRDLVKILLFEKEKAKKILMMIRGYLDYRKGKVGKYEK
jgi:rhamnosyltransferase